MSSLTPEMLRTLSPGACKVLLAMQIEPGASDKRLGQITGYSARWVKTLKQEVGSASVPGQEEKAAISLLRSVGVETRVARELAERCNMGVVREAVAYVKGRQDVRNPAGYVVKRLSERADVKSGVIAGTEEQGQPFAAGDVSVELPAVPGGEQRVELDLLAYSVSVACGCDPVLDPAVRGKVLALYEAGYRAEDIGYFVKHYWPTVWPGKTGEPPTLEALLTHVGHARHLVDMAVGVSAGDELLRRVEKLRKCVAGAEELGGWEDLLPEYNGNPQFSPYHEHPRYREGARQLEQDWREDRRREAEAVRLRTCPECRRLREVCKCASVAAIPRQIKHAWQMTLGQVQGQVNAAMYNSWVRRIELVSFDGHCLVLEVSHRYTQEYLNEHLKWALEQTLNGFLDGGSEPAAGENGVVLRFDVMPAADVSVVESEVAGAEGMYE